jgi:hypothetical protein
MKTSTAMMALVVGLSVAATAEAQLFQRRQSTSNPRTVPGPKPIADDAAQAGAAAPNGNGDKQVLKSGVVIPEPVNIIDLPRAKIPLPSEPIEPFLLTRENGPFMVLAHTFKGEFAEKYAQVLAMELRAQGYPAYVFRPKDFPMRSFIRGVPPNANPGVNRAFVGFPEIARIKDEVAVLVGNEKTTADAEKLMHKIKKVRPACLDLIPDPLHWRKGKGLKWAIQTTNPYVPAEELFSQTGDPLIRQMNQGPHSVFTCPGRYSLQIAEFAGRKAIIKDGEVDKKFSSMFDLRKSPLATAGEDAEKLAASLARDKQVMQAGYVPYVYHDRYSSKVFIGAFNQPVTPEAIKLREHLLKIAVDLNNRKVTDTMIVPAIALQDLTGIKKNADAPRSVSLRP